MTAQPVCRLLAAVVVAVVLAVAAHADGRPDRLTSRPRPGAPAAKPLAVGDDLRTEAGQRRRAVLPDGSVAYLNENTAIKLTADRWRALDSDSTAACQAAARVLRALGADRDLAWDYLTTPVGQRPGESGPWAGLAQTLRRQGEAELADRAYAAAFGAEPTNAQLLWDRAENLRQSGKAAEARKLYRQLADGSWQPRFAWLQSQARWQLGRQ